MSTRTTLPARGVTRLIWMEWRELAEAIPPAYTEFIGSQLLSQIQRLERTG